MTWRPASCDVMWRRHPERTDAVRGPETGETGRGGGGGGLNMTPTKSKLNFSSMFIPYSPFSYQENSMQVGLMALDP